jgi:hypothetical protein
MKLIVSLVAVAVAVATPALAASKKKKLPRAQQSYNQVYPQDDYYDHQNRRAVRIDSFDVYSNNGQWIGRDPDPNIRMRLRDEDMFFRNR